MENILLFKDNRGYDWINEMISLLQKAKCEGKEGVVFFWWHVRPSGKSLGYDVSATIKQIRENIKEYGHIKAFGHIDGKLYLLEIVDFIEDPLENLTKIQKELSDKYKIANWWNKPKNEIESDIKRNIEIEGGTAYPRILFVISNVFCLDSASEKIINFIKEKVPRQHMKLVEEKVFYCEEQKQ